MRTILIFAIVFLAIRFLLPLLLGSGKQKRSFTAYNNPNTARQKKPEGTITVEDHPKQEKGKKQVNINDGEYVDYEELDD